MYIYLISLIITLFFSFVSTKIKNKLIKNLFRFFSILPFLIVSAIRYDVGTDYIDRYATAYRLISNGYDVPSIEFLFKLIIKCCCFFTKDSSLLFITTSAIILIPLFCIIYKESVNPSFSFIVFFCYGFYFQSMNIVRQYVALSILIVGFYLYTRNKKKTGIFLALLTIFIHNVSYMGLLIFIFYELSKHNFKFNNFKLLIIIALIFLFRTQIIKVFIMLVSFTRFSNYIGGIFDVSQFNKVSFAINMLSLLVITYIKKIYKLDDKKSDFFILMQSIAMILFSMSSIFSLFNRVVSYFSIFQVVSIPYFISKVLKGKDRMMFSFIYLLILFTNIFYSNFLNNYGEVLPYTTIFNK